VWSISWSDLAGMGLFLSKQNLMLNGLFLAIDYIESIYVVVY